MLYVGITGKGAFLQTYSHARRYGGYAWFHIGMVCYFLFVLGMHCGFLNGKKISKVWYAIPPILLFGVHMMRHFM